jgi:hypothetical protein
MKSSGTLSSPPSVMPRATKFSSGLMNSVAKAASEQLNSSRSGWATPTSRRSCRPGRWAGISGTPSRAASTPAMYSSRSISACVCAGVRMMPASQNATSFAICIAGASEK